MRRDELAERNKVGYLDGNGAGDDGKSMEESASQPVSSHRPREDSSMSIRTSSPRCA